LPPLRRSPFSVNHPLIRKGIGTGNAARDPLTKLPLPILLETLEELIGTKGIRENIKNSKGRVDTRVRGIKEVAKKVLKAV